MSEQTPMPREICCKNWVELFNYIENTSNLPSGLTGRDAVNQFLIGLVNNQAYLIQDPNDESKFYPVKEEHLRDERYWHSNEFSINLFENAAKAIGGFRPLFQAGILAGYNMLEKAQPKHLQILRLVSPNMVLKIVGLINSKFNATKNPASLKSSHGYSRIKFNYSEEFKKNISVNVCDWNAGIYTGIGKYTGAHNINVTESECVTNSNDDCIFDINWTHLGFYRRLIIFLHSIFDPDYIRDRDLDNLFLNDNIIRQKGIIKNKTEELEKAQAKLIEAEKRTLEHRITGGFAHEIRNALTGAQLELKIAGNFQGHGKTTSEILRNTATALLKKIATVHDKYGIPKETIAADFIPELKNIAEISEILNKIHSGVSKDIDRGLAITSQIRDYARISELKKGDTSVDLVKMLKGYESQYQYEFKKYGINYYFEGIEAANIIADETHLNSIFSNLIINSKDALAECQKDDLKITVNLEKVVGHIRISILDNGPGIPEDKLKEIFEPFFSTKPNTGTGLGLGIVKRLIELYEGKFLLETELGCGTKFTIIFPE